MIASEAFLEHVDGWRGDACFFPNCCTIYDLRYRSQEAVVTRDCVEYNGSISTTRSIDRLKAQLFFDCSKLQHGGYTQEETCADGKPINKSMVDDAMKEKK